MQADVYRKTDGGMYLAKVSFPKLGMYIAGWTVRSSPNYPEKGLWVQPPAVKQGFKYKPVIEFSGNSELFDLIRDEILRAVDAWNSEQDIVVEDIPEGEVTLDDIPF